MRYNPIIRHYHRRTASRLMHAIIYTRNNCPLCDEAKSTLEQYGVTTELVDIDEDSKLQQKYTNCVPVVVMDGQERFRGRVNEVLLRRLLRKG